MPTTHAYTVENVLLILMVLRSAATVTPGGRDPPAHHVSAVLLFFVPVEFVYILLMQHTFSLIHLRNV